MTESETPTDVPIPEAVQAMQPDAELPPQLKHEKIREVRDRSSYGRRAYQIVFDQHFLPYSYWNPKPEGWEITYARTEFHNDFNGALRWLFADKECITIVVSEEREDDD